MNKKIFRKILPVGIAFSMTLGLYIIAYNFNEELFFGDISEKAFDIKLKMNQSAFLPHPKTPPFVFVDIDQEIYEELGRPTVIPYFVLGSLMESVAGKIKPPPKLIILDMDISWPSASECKCESTGKKFFIKTLREFNPKIPAVLLVRQALEPNQKLGERFLRKTPFDDVVKNSDQLAWVSVGARVSGDGIVRRTVWGAFDDHKVTPNFFPSVALFSATLIANDIADKPLESKNSLINRLKEIFQLCKIKKNGSLPTVAIGDVPFGTWLPLPFDGNTSIFKCGEPFDRIRYTIPWLNHSASSLVTVISAREFMPSENERTSVITLDDPLKAPIVIIGTSAPDKNDIFLTPLGEMPGAFIILNQIRALLEFGQQGRVDFFPGLVFIIFMAGLVIISFYALRYAFPKTSPVVFEHSIGVLSSVLFFLFLITMENSSTNFGIVFLPYVTSIILTIMETSRRDT